MNGDADKICFERRLTDLIATPEMSGARLTRRLIIEIGLLCVVPIAAVVVSLLTSTHYWNQPGEMVIVGLLKISSIGLLGYHTQKNAPEGLFRGIGSIMYVIALVYAFYLIEFYSPCDSKQVICQWPHYQYTELVMTFISFIYMFIFFGQNIYSNYFSTINTSTRLFNGAFLFGVNIPSIIAFCLILAMYAFNLVDHPDIFLHGAVALLIFTSTAGAICIDYYAQPLVAAGAADCPRIALLHLG
jgi:hypothetical protein